MLKYPKPVRKVHKYEKMLKKDTEKDIEIQSRIDAIKSKYDEEFEDRISGKKSKSISETESKLDKIKSIKNKITKK